MLLHQPLPSAEPPVPKSFKDALLLAYQQQCELEEKQKQIMVLTPKAEYTDKVLTAVNEWTTTTIASELGMTAQELNSILHQKGIIYRNTDRVWIPYAKYTDKGFTKTYTHTYQDSRGNVRTAIHNKWTEKGRQFIHLLLNRNLKTDGVTVFFDEQ